MDMNCPYCKQMDFRGMDYSQMHMHLIDCSKKYLDSITRDSLAHMRAYIGLQPCPPVHAHYKIDRRGNALGRRKVNEDRRCIDRTFYHTGGKKFGEMTRSGYYMDEFHFVQTDRREAKGLRRRNSPQRRRG